METTKLTDLEDPIAKAREEQKKRRDAYFARVAEFMKGGPKLSGERLRKTQASCPPKTYRKAAA